jgi:hypothetical protein
MFSHKSSFYTFAAKGITFVDIFEAEPPTTKAEFP